jgi:hypothetical protein
MQTPS